MVHCYKAPLTHQRSKIKKTLLELLILKPRTNIKYFIFLKIQQNFVQNYMFLKGVTAM